MKNTTYINAGAGSGKTYTLTNLLAEKLSNGEVEPSQVILTTFTELAAAEFREKARVQILDEGKLDAAAQMDSAAMGTVHSVALHFIQKFWYLLDYGADIQPISERDEDYYMNQSLARIMNETDTNGKLKTQADLDNFKRFRNYFDICDSSGNPDYLFWQRYLRDIVEKMEYYNVTNLQISIEKSIETLRAVFNKNVDRRLLPQLLIYLNAYYQYLLGLNTGVARTQREAIAPLLNNCNNMLDLRSLAKDLEHPAGRNINANCPEYALLMAEASKVPADTENLTILEPFVKSIFKLAEVWRNDYINYKKKNRLISYNDMEQLFLQLLTDEKEVQDYVSSHYRLVMVDEFQDSNPIQLKIFNRLSELVAQGGGHSYWVGDPKQAIYGFRGSDTELVNSVARHFGKFYNDSAIHPEEGPNNLGTGRLTQSWRSRQQLVELVNETFYEPFKKDGINDLLIKLDAHHKIDNVTYPAIAHLESTAHNVEGAALDLATQVKQLLQSKMLVHKGQLDCAPSEISPRDIAVLCKTNEDAKKIVKALRGLHVPVSEPEDAIMQRIEVQLVVTLLHFLQNPSDKHVRADLMRLLWGKKTEEILKDRIDYVEYIERNNLTDQWQDDAVLELLKQSERYKHLSIPEMVRGLIYECNIPALTARWGDAHIRQQNLATLQHLANDYDEMCLQMGQGSSISGFINYLNSNEPDKEKDNMSDTVKVFTYHGAKGLEWPVVIMHGLQKDVMEQKDFIRKNFMRVREMVLNDNATAADPFNKDYYIHFFPFILKQYNSDIPAAVLDNIVIQPIHNLLLPKAASEERRLLYVGMTRAKDQLITFGYNGKYNWLINAGVVNPTVENVWGKEEFKPCQLEPTALLAEDDANASDEYSIKEKPTKHTSFEKRYLSPSKIETFDGYTTHRAWTEKGTEISSKGWGSDYATIGTCIHDIFAVYRPGQDEANKEAALRVIGGYGFMGQLAGHVDAILRSADWLYDQLQQHFPQREGDGTEREYPFQATLPTGQTLRGEMDLLWHYSDEHGQYCVLVDYKSFQGVDLHSYSRGKYPQLSAYASSLKNAGIDVAHALIYYPVHGVIHELQ